MGLRIMDFRARMIGGNFEVRSKEGEGTLVQVVLDPMAEEVLTLPAGGEQA